tara:strand:+ start:70 stop:324 length:255 start_codon:yes stop_codon:yes gene_type:complete
LTINDGILNDQKSQRILIGFWVGTELKMNFQHQIAKALNNPPFGLSKAASKYDSEALAEFNFRAKTATQTNTSAFRIITKSIKT